MILLLLFSQAVFGSVNLGTVSAGGPAASTLEATACATESQAAWDNFSWQVDPFDVTAANTQSSAGCSMDSKVYFTPSLP